MSDKRWIDEQKENRLFRGGGTGSDSTRMLEHGPTNRILSVKQARKFTSARFLGDVMGIKSPGIFCDMLEKAQMCVDARTRLDFMKVSIEQWQGKVAAGRKFSVESLV